MSNELATVTTRPAQGIVLATYEDTQRFAKAAITSALFLNTGSEPNEVKMAQATMLVLAGMEMGIPPVEALRTINLIKGRVSMSAGAVAARVKRSGTYNYRVRECTDTKCRIEFFEDGESAGMSEYTIAEATKSGLAKDGSPWTKTPSDMLFARALTRGARRFCPDVFGGHIYTSEELGAPPAEEAPISPVTAKVVDSPAPEPSDADQHAEELFPDKPKAEPAKPVTNGRAVAVEL